MNRVQFYEQQLGAIVREAGAVPFHIQNRQTSDACVWVVHIDVQNCEDVLDTFDYLDNFGEYRFNYEIKERSTGDWHYVYFKDARNLNWYQVVKEEATNEA